MSRAEPLFQMMASPWFGLVVVVWLGGWIAASILFRRFRGKPIYPRMPANAVFAERSVSGYSHRNALTKIGGAHRCLIVTIANGRLTIVPQFPFNLLFLPEIYGLEVDVPLASVKVVSVTDGILGKKIQLSLGGYAKGDVSLRLSDVDRFGRTLSTSS